MKKLMMITAAVFTMFGSAQVFAEGEGFDNSIYETIRDARYGNAATETPEQINARKYCEKFPSARACNVDIVGVGEAPTSWACGTVFPTFKKAAKACAVYGDVRLVRDVGYLCDCSQNRNGGN